jgi:hypothetical protein
MKLDENVLWDTKSHVVHGFAGDFESLDRSIRAELTGNTEKQPAVEVNQWKYRTINGKEMLSFECELFYNDGSLLSNASPSHFKPRANQLPSYWMGYRRGFEERNVDEDLSGKGAGRTPHSIEWLDTTYLSCVHPVDRGRRVFFWLCSTHQIKSLRTQLWTSQIQGKRGFISVGGYHFGWDWLMEQFERDKIRPSQETCMTDLAMFLDGWAKMNVALAKAPFRLETLSEGMRHVCELANIIVPIGDETLYENDSSCCRPILVNGRSPLLGMFSTRLTKVKNMILQKRNLLGNGFAGIMSKIALLEFQATVHELQLTFTKRKQGSDQSVLPIL